MPQEWQTKKLGDFFTDEQLRYIEQAYQDSGGDVMQMIDTLRPFFMGLGKRLEVLGLLPSFAVYAVPYWYVEARKQGVEPSQPAPDTDDLIDRIMGQGGQQN